MNLMTVRTFSHVLSSHEMSGESHLCFHSLKVLTALLWLEVGQLAAAVKATVSDFFLKASFSVNSA
jgi:hypothetical protein